MWNDFLCTFRNILVYQYLLTLILAIIFHVAIDIRYFLTSDRNNVRKINRKPHCRNSPPLIPQTLFPFTAKPAVIISCENIFIKIFNIHLKKFQRKFYKNIIFKLLFLFHKYLLCVTEQISYSIVAKASVFYVLINFL